MTRKLPLELKETRKPIHTACGFCHDKHLQCDVGRPCQNCVRRNISSMCKDKVRKRRKKSDISDLEREEFVSRQLDSSVAKPEASSSSVIEEDPKTKTALTANFGGEPKISSSSGNIPRAMDEAANTIIANSLLDEPNVDISDDTGWGFDSIWTNKEYMKLNDLTALVPEMSPNELGPTEEQSLQEMTENPSPRRSDSSQMFQYLNFGSTLHRTESRPYISLNMVQPGSVSSASDFTTNQVRNGENPTAPRRNSSHNQSQQQQKVQSRPLQHERPSDEPELELTPYRLRQIIKTPKDLFEKRDLIKPHNYREAYRDLLKCLHNMFLGSYYKQNKGKWEPVSDEEEQTRKRLMRKEQLQHIARSIGDHYMPKFVALTSNMVEEDLSLQEFVLQRSLLEFENISKLVNCTPICIWRRSGEICFVSNEFCSLTGLNKREILDQRRFIVEFMDHQSVVNYYNLFNEHLAFGPKESMNTVSHDDQAVYAECNLLLNSGSYLKCACCLTARRDAFNISLLLMGQFLPIFDVQ